MRPTVRDERPDDAAAIEALTQAAFQHAAHSSHTEHVIVNALRRAGQLTLSLVAEAGGAVLGHVAVSPVTLSGGAPGWFGLGPLSVRPEWQGQGMGTQLVSHALARLRARGAAGCVLLGDPRYYGRFGFRAEAALVLPGAPPGYLMALAWRGPVPSATVAFHAAFDARP